MGENRSRKAVAITCHHRTTSYLFRCNVCSNYCPRRILSETSSSLAVRQSGSVSACMQAARATVDTCNRSHRTVSCSLRSLCDPLTAMRLRSVYRLHCGTLCWMKYVRLSPPRVARCHFQVPHSGLDSAGEEIEDYSLSRGMSSLPQLPLFPLSELPLRLPLFPLSELPYLFLLISIESAPFAASAISTE